MKIKTYSEAIKRVFIIEETRDYSLERVEKAMMLLWNPLKNIKIIHIAGTNWKWSTSKMVFSVLKNAWKKVWAFTQPHLLDLKERFITDSWEITESEFVEFLNKILDLDLKFSFFEKTTLISFLLFEKREVEYAVVEVGFWGGLDSTNIVNPVIIAITSIWIDHTKVLWNTIEEISFHKAWIIKERIPIVYNHKNDVIKKIAEEKNAPIIFTKNKVKTNLIWDYQEKNASIAFEICKYLKISEDLILKWLQKVEHFGRLQYITPNLLIDWAHNKAWLVELKKYLLSLDFNKNICSADCWISNNIKLCFAQKKWKNWDKILEVFDKENNFILVESENKLMVEKAEILKEKILENKNINLIIKTPEEIFELSQKNKNKLYLIFWSLYMIWDFLKFVK